MGIPQHPHVSIVALAPSHDRKCFACGVEALDRYLYHQASQDARKYTTATFVLLQGGKPEVLGFYTLSATSVSLTDVPEPMAKKLPRYPRVPMILLGRLAVDQKQRGKGYGVLLLIDALRRCISMNQVGWTAVVVEAKDESTVAFYEHYHFIRFSPASRRLFLPRETIQASFGVRS